MGYAALTQDLVAGYGDLIAMLTSKNLITIIPLRAMEGTPPRSKKGGKMTYSKQFRTQMAMIAVSIQAAA